MIIPTEQLLNIPGIRVLSVRVEAHRIKCEIESTQDYSLCQKKCAPTSMTASSTPWRSCYPRPRSSRIASLWPNSIERPLMNCARPIERSAQFGKRIGV
jgi:hypothetical protein